MAKRVNFAWNSTVKHKLIAEQDVCNQALDMELLAPMVEAAMDTLGVERIEAVADRDLQDRGYRSRREQRYHRYVPKPIRGPAVREDLFSKEEFRYDPDRDVYICPADQALSPR